MMYLVFLLGFYLGGMLITAFDMYFGVILANIDEPRAKMLIWCIEALLHANCSANGSIWITQRVKIKKN